MQYNRLHSLIYSICMYQIQSYVHHRVRLFAATNKNVASPRECVCLFFCIRTYMKESINSVGLNMFSLSPPLSLAPWLSHTHTHTHTNTHTHTHSGLEVPFKLYVLVSVLVCMCCSYGRFTQLCNGICHFKYHFFDGVNFSFLLVIFVQT